jgi:hypothetical protein
MSEKNLQTEPVNDKWTPPPLNMENIDAVVKWWSLTHVFLEWNEEENRLYPCFGIIPHDEETLQAATNNRDFHTLDIFGFDVENRDENRFRLLCQMEQTFLHFYKEVFEIKSYERGVGYSFDLCRIVLPKTRHDEITKVIEQHGLTQISELIFFIISKAQDFYNENVRFYESKQQKYIVRNIDKEVNKAIALIERVEKEHDVFSDRLKSPDKLTHINFCFQNSETIKIEDPLLTYEFVKHFKEHYDNCIYKDWKLQLQLTPAYYEEDRRREPFRFRYAIALYNFLTQTGLINVGDILYPNNLMDCIYKIIEFSLIQVGKPEHTPGRKIKSVRAWILEHNLHKDTTFEKIEPDRDKLYKYFDKEFIDSATAVKRADAIKNGYFLAMRFKTQPLLNELIHISACLRDWHWRVSQQLENGPIIPNNPLPAEYETFKLLIDSTMAGKKFDKVTFHINGEEKSYTLADRLPIHFIQSALKYHYKSFREDYETDILQAEIKYGKEPGSFSSKTTGNFNLPEERFFPKFIDAFFNFLQNEATPLEKEYKPSDRYYSLIAKALHENYYFRDIYPEDSHLKSKVEYWHSLIKK